MQVPDRFGHFIELGNEDRIWAEVANYFSPQDEEVARRVIRDFFGRAEANSKKRDG